MVVPTTAPDVVAAGVPAVVPGTAAEVVTTAAPLVVAAGVPAVTSPVVAETAGPVVVGTANHANVYILTHFATLKSSQLHAIIYKIHWLRNWEKHGHILPGPAVLVATPAVVVTADGGCVVPDGGGVGVTGC